MSITAKIPTDGTSRIVLAKHDISGCMAAIALDNLALGPAIGGTRIWSYDSENAWLDDACLLARAMTNKAALAGLDHGGGKAVIWVPEGSRNHMADAASRANVMRWLGALVQSQGGDYVTCEDVGTTPEDMSHVRKSTSYVVGLPVDQGGYGDPSPYTARGVALCVLSVVDSLGMDRSCVKVHIQGVGHVGANLYEILHEAGMRLTCEEICDDNVARLEARVGSSVERLDIGSWRSTQCDIFCPCALGGVVDAASLDAAKFSVILGAANNQLNTNLDTNLLDQRRILYCPDYLVNAGGLISMAAEFAGQLNTWVETKLNDIPKTLERVRLYSIDHKISMSVAADLLANHRLQESQMNKSLITG